MILKDEQLADDVDLDTIAKKTANFSGSDLHELCRNAAMNCFIETVRAINTNSSKENEESEEFEEANASATPPPNLQHNCIRNLDFEVAFQKLSIKNLVSNKNRFDFTRSGF